VTARRDDTVVVGGGLIGLALAAELARRGQRVTVLERGEPGGEASGAAAGMLTPQAEAVAESAFFALSLESRNLYPAWVQTLREETGLDVGYRRMGLLRCLFETPQGETLFDAYRWQVSAGFPVEERATPSLRAELDGGLSPEVRSAVFFPEEAAVDPAVLTRAVWLSAERRGVCVRTGVSARAFRIERGVCRGVETDAGLFEAAATVDAAGAWAAFDQSGRVAIPVQPVRGQIVQLRVVGRPLTKMVCSDDVYLVPRPDGSVLVGSTVEHVGYLKAVTAEAMERLIGAAIRLVPALRSAGFVSAWSGLRPGTPDGLPVLGESGIPSLLFAAGHFRNGILLAPVTAMVMADLLTSRTARDLSEFSIARFSEAWSSTRLDQPDVFS